MKKIIALILLSFSLQSQTLVKTKQIGDGLGTGSVVVSGGTNGSLTYSATSSLPFIPTSSVSAFQPTIAGGYLPVINPTFIGTLQCGALTFTDTGVLAALQSSVKGYNQFIIQNSSTANNASAGVVVTNGLGTASTYFGEFGMNSSTFTGTPIYSKPNAVYLTGTTGDLVLATTGASSVLIGANGASVAAITINTLNAVTVAGGQTITAGTIPNHGIAIRDLVGTSTSWGIYGGKIPDATNSSFGGDNAGNTVINYPTGSAIIFQSNGANTYGSISDARWSIQPGIATSGNNNALRVLCPNSTGLTASTNVSDISFSTASNKQFATGNHSLYSAVNITQPGVRYVGASTATIAAALNIAGPVLAGGSASYSLSAGLNIESGSAINSVGNATIGTGINVNAPTGATSNYSGIFSGGLGVWLNNINVVLGTTTGTKFGTATTQKIGFFNATPIVQVPATTDLGLVLSNLGLRAAGTAWPLTTSGAINFSGTTAHTNVSNTFKHIAGNQAVGTGTLGTGAGTSPTFTLTTCTDLSGHISITTGTTPTALGTLITIPFGAAYVTNLPKVILTPRNKATRNLAKGQEVWPTTSLTQLILNSNDTALPASTLLEWDYFIIQ